MASSPKPESPGCVARLLGLWSLFFTVALLLALFFISKPQELTDIGGYGPSAGAAAPRDLKAVMQASLRQGHSLALSEAEINRWLGKTLKVRQGGGLAEHVKFERVWLRLDDKLAEIIMERRVMGRPFTVSMYVMIEQTRGSSKLRTVIHRHGGPYLDSLPKPMRGGRFGSLVVPQGFLNLVIPSFVNLAGVYSEEIKLALESMSVVRIEKDRLILEPRPKDAGGSDPAAIH